MWIIFKTLILLILACYSTSAHSNTAKENNQLPKDSEKVSLKSLLQPVVVSGSARSQRLTNENTSACDGVCMNVYACDRYEGMPVDSTSCPKDRVCCKCKYNNEIFLR